MASKFTTASIVFYVSDIVRTEAFYNQTLGLDLRREEGMEPFILSGELAGGLQVTFFQMDAVRGSSPAVVFTIDGGIDDVVAGLAEKGVNIVTPVSEARAAGVPTFWTRMALAWDSGNRGTCRAR